MKELNRKVFKTIFLILSLFIAIRIVIYNISSYKKEYDNIKRNLTFIEDRNINKPESNPPEPREFNNSMPAPKDRELNNMMIIDYIVYSMELNITQIDRIINHSNNTSSFDLENIAKAIQTKDKGIIIGNLYTNKYSYNYNIDTISKYILKTLMVD